MDALIEGERGAGPRAFVALAAAALTLAPAGCDSVVGSSDWSVRLGTLATGPEGPALEVPDSVAVGVAFTVRVRTRGGGCDRRGPTRVERGAGAPTVVPRDSIFVGEAVCPAVLRTFSHEATLTFDDPGRSTVRFRVRDPADGSVVEIDRSVEVGSAAAKYGGEGR